MDDQISPNQESEQSTDDQDTILVVSASTGSRGVLSRKLKVEELAVNVNLFIAT